MDGALIATVISSSVVVAGAISTGFWRLSSRVSNQSKSIGRLEGKVDGMDTRLDDFGGRVDRLEKRINSHLNNLISRNKERG